MKKIVVFILTAILLSACAQRGPTNEEIAAADYGSVPKDPQKAVMEHMVLALVDPQSAQYTKWSNLVKGMARNYAGAHYGYKGCVYVNSKNRMGGYTGFKEYVYIIKNDKVIFLEGGYTGGRGLVEVIEQCAAVRRDAEISPESAKISPEPAKSQEPMNSQEPVNQPKQPVSTKPLPVRISDR